MSDVAGLFTQRHTYRPYCRWAFCSYVVTPCTLTRKPCYRKKRAIWKHYMHSTQQADNTEHFCTRGLIVAVQMNYT